MAQYDWGWPRGRDRGFGARAGRGYDTGYSSWGDAWDGAAGAYGGWERGSYRRGPRFGAAGGYDRYDRGIGGYARGTAYGGGWSGAGDRGLYGGGYPTYGGYPGGREEGMYYGGRPGQDRGYRHGGYGTGGGYGGVRGRPGAPAEPGRGYDRGMAGEPFMPEEAYHRHPEYERPQRHMHDRWPDSGYGAGEDLDDEEVRQAVRQNLFNDSWVHADGIQVEVENGVVTLRGEVGDYMEARYAWDDAWESMGVRGVVNQLTVRTDQPGQPHGDMMPQTEGGKQPAAGDGE